MASEAANTFTGAVFKEDWATKLQERLGYDSNWKEVCNVEYTDTRVFNNPYMSTVPSLQSHTRGSAYTHQLFTLTNEYVTIDQSYIIPMIIDRADLAQCNYVKQMDMAVLQGQLIDEYLETDMLANHAMWTDFDNSQIGGDAGQITVSTTTIPQIIRAMKREIREANGQKLMSRNGAFIIWRAADFEILEAYCQAVGFNTADTALKSGIVKGFEYMGVTHLMSNLHTANHVFGGVKKLMHLGVLRSTFGQVITDEEPATASGAISGIAVISRLDWEYKVWTNTKALLFDISVS
jgi:hypothetical protein